MPRHPADLLSLVFGALFLAAGSLMVSNRFGLLGDLRWAGPVLLIVVAVAMLASVRWPWTGGVTGTMPPVDTAPPPGTGD
jgi:cytochrome c oxidase subunit IV